MTTLLITATAFDDRTILAYSLFYSEDGSMSPVHVCDANETAWAYLLTYQPNANIHLSVIDRRPGTRATSRCCGHSLTNGR